MDGIGECLVTLALVNWQCSNNSAGACVLRILRRLGLSTLMLFGTRERKAF